MLKNISKNILKNFSNTKLVLINTNFNKIPLKKFAFKTKNQQNSSLPEEIYSTPIYDKENKKFSESYLNFLFNKQNLNFTNPNSIKEKEIVIKNIVTTFEFYSEISNKNIFEQKLNYIVDYLYQNMHHFSCFQLIKIFKVISQIKLNEINLLTKLNFYIASKLTVEKRTAFEDKDKFEKFLNNFFVHFENSVENGITNKKLLNEFLGILNKENLNKLLSVEGNLINVIYLISQGIANINELENDNDKEIEKAYLEIEKNLLNKNGIFSLMKLFEKLNNFLSIGETENDSNSRNKLYKSLIYLKSEGISYEKFSHIEEFLNVYSYQIEEINNFNEEKTLENNRKIVEKYFDENKIEYEKDFEFKICKGNYVIHPGLVVNVYTKGDYFSGNMLQGRINLNNRYLKMLNYDVLSLSYDLFKEENRKYLDDILFAKINEIKEFNDAHNYDKLI